MIILNSFNSFSMTSVRITYACILPYKKPGQHLKHPQWLIPGLKSKSKKISAVIKQLKLNFMIFEMENFFALLLRPWE